MAQASFPSKNTQDLNVDTFVFTDGTISSVTAHLGEVVVEYLDWQERQWVIVFSDAIAYKSVSSEGEEISALLELDETDFSEEVKSIDGSKGVSFCFVSAWSDSVVLTVVAAKYEAGLRFSRCGISGCPR